jgi:hypothetical protein
VVKWSSTPPPCCSRDQNKACQGPASFYYKAADNGAYDLAVVDGVGVLELDDVDIDGRTGSVEMAHSDAHHDGPDCSATESSWSVRSLYKASRDHDEHVVFEAVCSEFEEELVIAMAARCSQMDTATVREVVTDIIRTERCEWLRQSVTDRVTPLRARLVWSRNIVP